jgi:hypothetical protein
LPTKSFDRRSFGLEEPRRATAAAAARAIGSLLGGPKDDETISRVGHDESTSANWSSVAQVRKPIYTTSVQRWKKYGAGLQRLVDAIGEKG